MASHAEYHSVLRDLTRDQCQHGQSQFDTRGERRVAQLIQLSDARNTGKQPYTRTKEVFYLEDPPALLGATMAYGKASLSNQIAHYGSGEGTTFLDSYGWHVGAGLPSFADEQVMRLLFKRDTMKQAAQIGGVTGTQTESDIGAPDKPPPLNTVFSGFVLNPQADFLTLYNRINDMKTAFLTNASSYTEGEIKKAVDEVDALTAQIAKQTAADSSLVDTYKTLVYNLNTYKTTLLNPPIYMSSSSTLTSRPVSWKRGWGDGVSNSLNPGAADASMRHASSIVQHTENVRKALMAQILVEDQQKQADALSRSRGFGVSATGAHATGTIPSRDPKLDAAVSDGLPPHIPESGLQEAANAMGAMGNTAYSGPSQVDGMASQAAGADTASQNGDEDETGYEDANEDEGGEGGGDGADTSAALIYGAPPAVPMTVAERRAQLEAQIAEQNRLGYRPKGYDTGRGRPRPRSRSRARR